MKIIDKAFLLFIILATGAGFNSFLSWARSPAVDPILEIPHNFPQNISKGNVTGYDLSRPKTIVMSIPSRAPIHVMRNTDFLLLGLGVFTLFGAFGFFILGSIEEPSRELPTPISFKKDAGDKKNLKKAS